MYLSIFESISWQTSFEILATITGIICVALQTKENIKAWPFGIVSVILLAFIFLDSRLFSDFILHIILLILNLYGWWYWSQKGNLPKQKVPVKNFKILDWLIWIGVIAIITPAWGWLMNYQFQADLAYVDAFTSVGSLVAQYLLAKKFLQNWIIWIVVDVVAIGVYLYKDLYYVAFLFLVFLVLSVVGYHSWRKEVNIT